MRYYVGVDGGGTKTEFVWLDESGKVVKREVGGSSNPNDIGKENAFAWLTETIEEKSPKDATALEIAMGLSGVGFAGGKKELTERLLGVKNVVRVEICTDAQIALDSAYDGDGCIVIIGTGSAGYVRKQGVCRLVGGGGYKIDRSLSGYDLGREAINVVLAASDGRGERTVLEELTAGRGVTTAELIKNVYEQGKAYVASFAPLVLEAYERRDEAAKEILQRCVGDFESLLRGVYRVYGQEHCEITLFGGLSRRWSVFSGFLSGEIQSQVTFQMPKRPVVYGAFKGICRNERVLSAFLQSYHSFCGI